MDLKLPKERTIKRDALIIKRLIAFIIDLLVVNIVIISPFQKVFRNAFDASLSISENIAALESAMTTPIYTAMFFIVVMALFYFSLLQLKTKQTVGMMITKLHVEGELTFWKAVARNIFIIPFFPFYILWVIEPVHLFFRGRRFLEEITHTRTVEIIRW